MRSYAPLSAPSSVVARIEREYDAMERENVERSFRDRNSRKIGKSSYMPSPAMRQAIAESMKNANTPFGSSCERADIEH